jgi:hypothetical protein
MSLLTPNFKHRLLLVVGASALFYCGTAHAYIDPGIGSILFQSAIAGLITLLAFWQRLKVMIRQFFSKKTTVDDSDPKESPSVAHEDKD